MSGVVEYPHDLHVRLLHLLQTSRFGLDKLTERRRQTARELHRASVRGHFLDFQENAAALQLLPNALRYRVFRVFDGALSTKPVGLLKKPVQLTKC